MPGSGPECRRSPGSACWCSFAAVETADWSQSAAEAQRRHAQIPASLRPLCARGRTWQHNLRRANRMIGASASARSCRIEDLALVDAYARVSMIIRRRRSRRRYPAKRSIQYPKGQIDYVLGRSCGWETVAECRTPCYSLDGVRTAPHPGARRRRRARAARGGGSSRRPHRAFVDADPLALGTGVGPIDDLLRAAPEGRRGSGEPHASGCARPALPGVSMLDIMLGMMSGMVRS